MGFDLERMGEPGADRVFKGLVILGSFERREIYKTLDSISKLKA